MPRCWATFPAVRDGRMGLAAAGLARRRRSLEQARATEGASYLSYHVPLYLDAGKGKVFDGLHRRECCLVQETVSPVGLARKAHGPQAQNRN